jgi:hypothetical protein
MSLTITSTAFPSNGAIPALYTCEGKVEPKYDQGTV